MLKSPRVLRPHTIVVINVLGEENYTQLTSITEVKLVNVSNKNVGKSFGNTGGTFSDSIIVTIDLNDYESEKAYAEDLDNHTTQFSFRLGDKILYRNKEYEITNVSDINGLVGPHLLEVIAQ